MKRLTVVLSVCAIVLAITGAAYAVGRDKGHARTGKAPERQGLFLHADQNGDGVITRDEFGQDALKHFEKLDANADGKVTHEEVQKAVDAAREKAAAHKGEGIAKLDKNNDGVITKDEVPARGQPNALGQG